VFEEGEPVVGVGAVVVEVEGVVVDADAEACVGEVVEGDALVEDVFDFFSVVFYGFGYGSGPSGSRFMVGFEVCDDEACRFDFLVKCFDGGREVVRGVWLVFEGSDGIIKGAGGDPVFSVFVWEFGFVVVSGGFVGDEGFDEAGFVHAFEPITDDDVADAKGVG